MAYRVLLFLLTFALLVAAPAMGQVPEPEMPDCKFPDELTAAQWKEMFGHMPVDKQVEVQRKMQRWRKASEAFAEIRVGITNFLAPVMLEQMGKGPDGEGAVQTMTLQFTPQWVEKAGKYVVKIELQMIYRTLETAFAEYPALFDPADEADYWRASADEFIAILDKRVTYLEKTHDDDVKKLAKWKESGAAETLKGMDQMEIFTYAQALPYYNGYGMLAFQPWNAVSMTPEEKERVEAGQPRFRNPFLVDINAWRRGEQKDDEAAKPGDIYSVIRRETEPTPKLQALGLTKENLERWDGSTSLHPLAERILHYQYRGQAENIRQCNTYYSTHFTQTHNSIMNVINGQRDLVFSARVPSDGELAAACERGIELVCTPFAQDAFVFLRNRYNPVKNLSQAQIRDIFSGKITQWKDVGGFGGTILLLTRNPNSGSEELMQSLVMRGVKPLEKMQQHNVRTMIGIFDNLEKNIGAIGYSVQYYEKYLAASPFATTISVDGISPTPAAIASAQYPYVYQCVLIHRKAPDAAVEKFVAWMLSDEGQRVVQESGYVPLSNSPENHKNQ